MYIYVRVHLEIEDRYILPLYIMFYMPYIYTYYIIHHIYDNKDWKPVLRMKPWINWSEKMQTNYSSSTRRKPLLLLMIQ